MLSSVLGWPMSWQSRRFLEEEEEASIETLREGDYLPPVVTLSVVTLPMLTPPAVTLLVITVLVVTLLVVAPLRDCSVDSRGSPDQSPLHLTVLCGHLDVEALTKLLKTMMIASLWIPQKMTK
jgi:hypothetical protein